MTIPLTGPSITVRSIVEFMYPYTSPTTTLELNRPKSQDDIFRLSLTRSVNVTRNLETKTFRDVEWPKEQTLLWTFSDLTYTELLAYRTFMSLSLGRPIKVIDWYTLQWECIVVNNTDEQTEDVDNVDCGPLYTVNIELISELKSWP